MGWLKEMYEDHGFVLSILDLLDIYSKRLNEGKAEPEKLTMILELSHDFTERCHHGKEERALFPILTKRSKQTVDGLLLEHEKGKALIKGISDSGKEKKIRLISEYQALIKAHIEQENLFFKECGRKLDRSEIESIESGFDRINAETLGKAGRKEIAGRISRIKESLK